MLESHQQLAVYRARPTDCSVVEKTDWKEVLSVSSMWKELPLSIGVL